ncbi:MAG: peroxide stress protein YaaA [Actinobacteria bacterium]|nr:peroxide stress protein YaaA [Actinomycetota bacterium]
MAARTLVLIPPSEGKASGGRGAPWRPGTMRIAELDEPRVELLAALGAGHPVHEAPTMAAIERYTGVLYKELDAGSITGTAKRRLNANVLTVSGLWGLVAPRDPIPDYRLKMSASVPPLGRLSTWWPPEITAALVERARGAVVWDLLPNEHAAAIDWTAIAPRLRVTATFLDHNGRTVSHWNKLLKGSIVRWLVESGEQDPLALADFEHPQGYALDVEASTFDLRTAELVLRER